MSDQGASSGGRSFCRDERLERLLALKESDPEAWDRLAAVQKMSAGYYAAAKSAATDPD